MSGKREVEKEGLSRGLPPPNPTPREATKSQRWEEAGGEGLLYELLEGTDSEAAVAHVGVRGTCHCTGGGGRRVTGSTPGRAHSWRPLPREPGFAPRDAGESLPSMSIPHRGRPLQLH